MPQPKVAEENLDVRSSVGGQSGDGALWSFGDACSLATGGSLYCPCLSWRIGVQAYMIGHLLGVVIVWDDTVAELA